MILTLSYLFVQSAETSTQISSSGDWPGDLLSSDSNSGSGSHNYQQQQHKAAPRRRGGNDSFDSDEDDEDEESDYDEDDSLYDDRDMTLHGKHSALEDHPGRGSPKAAKGGSGGTKKRGGGGGSDVQPQQQKGKSPKFGVKNLEDILAEAKRTPPPTAAAAAQVPEKQAQQQPKPTPPKNSPQQGAKETDAAGTAAAGNKQRQPLSWIASRVLSEKAHAKVSKGFNFALGQSIIIKQFTLFDVPAEMRQERYDLIERIEGEVARASKQLPKHENIINYIGANFSDNVLYIFTEFVAGGSVESVLREATRLDESVIKRYTKQVLQAISLLHSKGFFNLNIKVSNMLLDSQGNVKLCDFVATQELSDLVNGVFRTNMDYFLLQDERTKELQHKRHDIQNLGFAVVEMATGSRDPKLLPESFSKEARAFIEVCTKGSVILTLPFSGFGSNFLT